MIQSLHAVQIRCDIRRPSVEGFRKGENEWISEKFGGNTLRSYLNVRFSHLFWFLAATDRIF